MALGLTIKFEETVFIGDVKILVRKKEGSSGAVKLIIEGPPEIPVRRAGWNGWEGPVDQPLEKKVKPKC